MSIADCQFAIGGKNNGESEWPIEKGFSIE
jgi:hypothetical protein